MEEDSTSAIEAEIGGAGDDFSVDELLDFSNGYSDTEEQKLEETELKPSPLIPEKEEAAFPENDLGEICFQAEGLESLEWVSHFMDDSFPDYALAAEKSVAAPPCFTNPVQTKARTKRVWHVSSSDSQKRRKAGVGAAAQGRRCSHCGATKTPQWRAGPEGAKTLCNACGVRYKSGRLVPEYRPACSPYFSTEMHSNNHRKVLEMRRKKEMEMEISNSDGIL
ncbi:GATA transcription factor 5-like [Salvia hispanica]|uniref:GATA transcription factor 5-like n=1 Tax=Salvia hispanica TaxID=49212 RepID=UPI002008FDBD|nr:GATA transcription factor 5-like [Salvia hispanica]